CVFDPVNATGSQMLSGWYGLTPLPPTVGSSSPPTNRALSRTCSASSRNRGPRAYSRFSGSARSNSGVTFDERRNAADVTSNRTTCLMSQGEEPNPPAPFPEREGGENQSPLSPWGQQDARG